MIDAIASGVEASALGGFVRGTGWAYPVANLVHLLGLVMLLGGIGLVDLRLAGLFRSLPVDPLMRALTPVAIAGLTLAALSGPVLFAADARALAGSATFVWKLTLIVLAVVNALCFRWVRQGREGEASPAERAMALASIGLWMTVAALGRLIAYN